MMVRAHPCRLLRLLPVLARPLFILLPALLDELGGLFGDHDYCCHGVAGDDGWHDWSVHHTQATHSSPHSAIERSGELERENVKCKSIRALFVISYVKIPRPCNLKRRKNLRPSSKPSMQHKKNTNYFCNKWGRDDALYIVGGIKSSVLWFASVCCGSDVMCCALCRMFLRYRKKKKLRIFTWISCELFFPHCTSLNTLGTWILYLFIYSLYCQPVCSYPAYRSRWSTTAAGSVGGAILQVPTRCK